MQGPRARVWQFVAAIVGTVIVSVLGAFFAFGQGQAEQLVRLEQSESEDLRQQRVDQAFLRALEDGADFLDARLASLEARVAVLEAQLEQLLLEP
jgi:Tfp pilus assembly protein PilO